MLSSCVSERVWKPNHSGKASVLKSLLRVRWM